MSGTNDTPINYSPLADKTVGIDRLQLVQLGSLNPQSPQDKNLKLITDNFRQYVDSIEIFEDIFKPGLTGQVYVRDPNALSNAVLFLGVEGIILEFSISDRQTGQPRKYGPLVLQVYNQTRRTPFSQGTEKYALGLCSPEIYNSTVRRFSKKYYDFAHNIVQDIVTSPYGLATSKKFVPNGLEQTKSKMHFAVPYMRPLDALRLLMLHGITPTGESNYVFFETLRGYHFCSMQTLIKIAEREIIPTIYMDLAGQRIEGNTKTRIKAEKLELVSGFDMLYATNQGYFGSTTIAPDVLSGVCGIEMSGLGMDGAYDKRYKVNQNGIDLYPKEVGLATPPTTRIFVVPTTAFSASNKNLTRQDPSIYDNFLAQTIDGRMRELVGLQLRCIRGVIAGAPELEAGTLINVEFPTPANNNNMGQPKRDAASGRYLITNARHIIRSALGGQGFYYETVFEAVTDSFAKS